MSRKWAKRFYNSKEWKNTRDAYFYSQNGICELCGKPGEEVHHKKFLRPGNVDDYNIALNWKNLQLLCRSCHNSIHDKAYQMYRVKNRRSRATTNELTFNEDGELVENKNVFIVWGAPASGKTRYVLEHKGRFDLVVDLDYLMAALNYTEVKQATEEVLPFALDVRDYMYELIAERKHYFDKVWIVATLPLKEERYRLSQKLKAELIHIDTDKKTCLEYAREDDERVDKSTQYRIIEKYFDRLEE